MSQASTRSAQDAPAHDAKSSRTQKVKGSPFLGILDPIIVEDPAEFLFGGALPREHADRIWTWMTRDVAPDMITLDGPNATDAAAFDAMMPGPVVLGGGVIAHLTGVAPAIADIVRAAGHEPDIRMAADGTVGAAVLALRAVGITVDEAMVATIAASMAGRAPSAVAP